MTAGESQKTASWRSENKPLFWALLISLGVHALLIWLVVVVGVAMMIMSASRQQVLAEMKHLQAIRTNLPPQEPQLIFIETDPAQAAAEAPKDAKYYSSRNSQASNPDVSADANKPKIDGTQVHVLETKDVPRSKQFPLQPSAPKDPAPPEEKPATKPDPTPKSSPKPDQTPGDLALLTKPATPQPEHTRPHTLAEVQQTKFNQDGGVARHNFPVSFDAKGSPFGEYDERVVAAIRQHWYDLIDSHSVTMDHVGKVVVEFRLNYTGSITDLKILESDVGELQSYLCKAAIMDPAPYQRWPDDMRRMIDAPYREVTFTFYYE